MANIAAAPFGLTDLTFKVGADNYETSISAVEFVPTVPTFSWAGATPGAVYNFSGAPSWVINVTAIQDWTTTNSLSQYLLANVNKVVTADFAPVKGGKVFRANITLVPGNIGGAANTVPTLTVSFQVQGQPTIVTA